MTLLWTPRQAPAASVGTALGAAPLGLLAAVLYSDWVFLEPTFGRGLSPVHAFVSELGAATRPGHLLFNAADILSGLCVLLLAYDVRRRLRRDNAECRGVVSLAVFGVATSVGGFMPMTCAPSVQAGCSAGGAALHASLQDQVATAFSVIAAVAVVLSMSALGRTAPENAAWRGVLRHGPRLFALAAPLTVLVGVLGLLDLDVGLPQRALILLDSAWVGAVSIALLRSYLVEPWTGTAHGPRPRVGRDFAA